MTICAERRRRRRAALVALTAIVLVGACSQRSIIRAPHGMPASMPLRAAYDGLPGGAGEGAIVPLDDNARAWAARWDLIASAERTLEASYFIVERDAFGMSFLGHLYKKALEGVKVRLLLDGRGALPVLGPVQRDYLQELIATGNVVVSVHNPLLVGATTGLLSFDVAAAIASSHDKILVADTRRAIIGGRNIAAPYFVNPAVDPTATIDADVLLQGERVARALRKKVLREMKRATPLPPERVNAVSRHDELLLYYAAMDAWLRMDPSDPRTGAEAALAVEGAAVSSLERLPTADVRARVRADIHELVLDHQLRGASPLVAEERFEGELHVLGATSRARGFDYRMNGALLQVMAGAERELVIETPYFILTRPALAAFEELARRGVQITVLTNSPLSSDNAASQALFVDAWPELMARVPTLRVFVFDDTRLLHAKRMVLDGTLTLVGTYNMDPLSARVNSEVVTAVWSEAFGARTRASIDALRQSDAVLEYRVARDPSGEALRHPEGHPQEGAVVVLFGPEQHVPAPVLGELRTLKKLLLGTAGWWDFEVAVW